MSTDKEKSKSATKKKSAVKKTTPKKVSTTKKTKVKEESLDTKPISQETFSVLMDVVSDANKREEPVKKTKAKTPVQAWMEEHQVTLNRCYTWCSTNDWRFAHNQQSEYDAQLSLVITILDTLKRFTEQFTAYLQYKYVSEFVDKYASTVRQFVDRCRSYVDSNNWILIDNDDLRNLERDFQVGIVKDVDRINEKYNKLGLKEEISYFTLSFHADKVAPFLMKGIIEEKFPKVKELQESIQKMEEEQNALVYPTYNVYSCLNSTELFRNIKNPPPYDPLKHYYEQPQSTIDFFEEEYNKIVNGVNIGGIHISGFLYWHINYFKTDIPMAMFKGTPLYNPRLERIITHPFLRDNELFFDHCYTKASQENVGVFVFGTRRFGKALWVKEKLRYEDGSFRDIKHVRKGDKIIAGDGYPTLVTGVFPQGVVDLYKITFSDKREIVCCDEHLWKVFDGKTWNVLNLKTIRERMYAGDKFSIPPTPVTGYTTDLVLNWFGSVPEMSKVEYFGKDEAICISVSNSDKLFLTSNGIVTHNTVLESSYIGWRNTVVPNSESLVIGGDDGDLQKLSKTIEVSFSNVHPAFALPRNNNDWTSHIQFGLKSKDGVRIPYSDIYIRNVNAGTKQGGVKTAGATPTAWVCDEAGKFACKLMYFQAIPSFQNPTGWGVTPILVGTGGETSLSADAREMLLNPKANKILAMDWDALENFVPEEKLITWKRKTFGIFVPAQLSYKEGLVKDITTLADFHKSDSESLKNIDLHVTNWQLANDVINQSRKDMEDDKTAIAQEKMGYPIDPMECFLNKVENPFCAREAQDHYDTIVEEGDTGKKVDFIRESDGKTLKSFFSDKELAPYPFPGGNVDAPFVVFEDPPLNPQVDYTYASGLDHYKHDKADTDSVGVMYIFKRQVDINDPWADRIVAVYASRPDTIDAFNDNCEMLLDGYGAICLMENADTSFEQHLRRKFKHNIYLANGQDLAKDVINPTAQQNNPVGLSPTPKNKAYCLSLVINYCNEMITVGYDDEGVPIQKRGVYRIPDPLLLKEIINFSYDGNFDRIVAFGHALALSRYWDRLNLLPDTRRNNLDEDRVRAMYQQMRSGKSPYSAGSKNPYNTGSKSPYRTYR